MQLLDQVNETDPTSLSWREHLQILVNAWMRRTTLMVKHFTSFRHTELWTNVDEPSEKDHPIVKCLTGVKNSIEKRNGEYHPNSKAPRASLILGSIRPVGRHTSHSQKQNVMLWIDTNHDSGQWPLAHRGSYTRRYICNYKWLIYSCTKTEIRYLNSRAGKGYQWHSANEKNLNFKI